MINCLSNFHQGADCFGSSMCEIKYNSIGEKNSELHEFKRQRNKHTNKSSKINKHTKINIRKQKKLTNQRLDQ